MNLIKIDGILINMDKLIYVNPDMSRVELVMEHQKVVPISLSLEELESLLIEVGLLRADIDWDKIEGMR